MSTKTFELVYTALNSQESNVGVIIVAAGSASRMAGTNKILAPIMGKSVISHTLLAFNNHPLVGDIVLVTRKDMILDLQKEVEKGGFNKVTDIIEGGNCREESVKKGFQRLIKNEKIKTVLIHDGARPLVGEDVIDRVIKASEEFMATVPAVSVKDTIKRIGTLGKVEETVDRENLVHIQTPQGFAVSVLKDSFEKAGEDLSLFTDDASLAERANYPVYTVEGDYKNIKITTPEDLILAEAYIKSIEGEF